VFKYLNCFSSQMCHTCVNFFIYHTFIHLCPHGTWYMMKYFIPTFILWTRQIFIIYFYLFLDWLGVITIQWAKKDVKLKTKLFKVTEIFMFCQNHGNYGKLLLIHSYECQRIQIKNLFLENILWKIFLFIFHIFMKFCKNKMVVTIILIHICMIKPTQKIYWN